MDFPDSSALLALFISIFAWLIFFFILLADSAAPGRNSFSYVNSEFTPPKVKVGCLSTLKQLLFTKSTHQWGICLI